MLSKNIIKKQLKTKVTELLLFNVRTICKYFIVPIKTINLCICILLKSSRKKILFLLCISCKVINLFMAK